MDEAQLSALIDAAVREAVERTSRELAAKHEADTEGLRRKRDELLDKVAKKDGDGKQPSATEDFDAWLTALDARIAKLKSDPALTGKTAPTDYGVKQTEVLISRAESRDHQKYQAAKAEAAAKGLQVRIVDEHAAAPVSTSRVKYLDDAPSRTLYSNKEVLREAGGYQRLKQNAERDGKRLVVFKNVDELPEHLHRAHAETLAANKPDTLLGGGQ
jgi:hypothetical protein